MEIRRFDFLDSGILRYYRQIQRSVLSHVFVCTSLHTPVGVRRSVDVLQAFTPPLSLRLIQRAHLKLVEV